MGGGKNVVDKTCTKCGETKPVTEFSRDARNSDGLNHLCKVCTRAANAVWREKNPDKSKAASAKWREKNREKCRVLAARWRDSNGDRAKATTAKWCTANPEARRIHNQNRRARSVGKLSVGLSKKLFKLQRGKCACGCKQPLGDDYHLDHIMPLALGGTNTDDNIQLLRQICNQQKYTKHPIDFMQSRGFLV